MTKLTLSEDLYLTMAIYDDEDEDRVIAWVHSAPVSREVFQANYALFGHVFSAVYGGEFGALAGPRLATQILYDTAKKRGDSVGAIALMNEIRRLTNVLMRTATGWESYAFQSVVTQGLLNPDDLAEVTNAILFFTVAVRMHLRREKKHRMMDGALRVLGAQTSSSDFTAFSASYETSTTVAPTAPVLASSVPF